MKFILLNAGTRTLKAFLAGAGGHLTESYKTKKIMLHIDARGNASFINHDKPIDFNDSYVFTRLRATDQHFCGMLYEYLRHHKIPASDPINLRYPHGDGKTTQMLLLALCGMRIPETFLFREESYAANRDYLLPRLQFPLIYKTDGRKGMQVHLIHSLEELDAQLTTKPSHALAIIQPFIENEFDTRTLVAYGEILGSIKRTRNGGYRNNVAQGATVSKYTLAKDEAATALRAAAACRIDFGGVDMIHTDKGPVVLEVNKSPQIKGFESVHNFKVFTRIAEILRSKGSAYSDPSTAEDSMRAA